MEEKFVASTILGTKLVKEAGEVSGNSKEEATYLALLERSLRFVAYLVN